VLPHIPPPSHCIFESLEIEILFVILERGFQQGATVCHHLWQYRWTVEHYNQGWCSALPLCFHQLCRQLPRMSCKNMPVSFVLTNETCSGKKPNVVPQRGSWIVALGQQCNWQHSSSRILYPKWTGCWERALVWKWELQKEQAVYSTR
jgi:hypothetical protein